MSQPDDHSHPHPHEHPHPHPHPTAPAEPRPTSSAPAPATPLIYVDCFSGISGDMLLGALLDAGLPLATLEAGLAKLDLGGYRLEVQPKQSYGITGTKLDVLVDEAVQPERRLAEILDLLDRSDLPPWVRASAEAVFRRLGEAEAKIHATTVDEVHFHEVGGVDSIVDIVGGLIGLHALGVTRIHASSLPLPGGTVRARHGLLPAPPRPRWRSWPGSARRPGRRRSSASWSRRPAPRSWPSWRRSSSRRCASTASGTATARRSCRGRTPCGSGSASRGRRPRPASRECPPRRAPLSPAVLPGKNPPPPSPLPRKRERGSKLRISPLPRKGRRGAADRSRRAAEGAGGWRDSTATRSS